MPRKSLRLDDEVHFIRSWMEKPLATGAVMPSGKPLARAMASYVDPDLDGPVIELGPGTGAVTAALVEQGVDPARLVLVEFNPSFCRAAARALSGSDRRARRRLRHPASRREPDPAGRRRPWCRACRCSPSRCEFRLRLVNDAFGLLHPGAPFIQFTYAVVPPIPKALDGVNDRVLRADLAQPAAGARMGLPPRAGARPDSAPAGPEDGMPAAWP